MRAEGFVPPHRKGRGGSVSRRDHSQAYRRRAQLAWAHKSEGTHKPIRSRSSGEGVWGGGASLREAASSPESPLVFSLVFSPGVPYRPKLSRSINCHGRTALSSGAPEIM